MSKVLSEDLKEIVCAAYSWKDLEPGTFLVTGATGLIGSLTVRSLLMSERMFPKGNHVIAAVRNMEKAKTLFADELQNENFEIIVQDFSEPISYDGNIDYVIHTACPTASKFMTEQPVETMHAIFCGTDRILKTAAEKHCRSVVYLSSMEAYGSVDTADRVGEDELGFVALDRSRSSYPVGKRAAECLCNAYCSEYNVPVKIVRLAQTFGAGVSPDDNRVFAQFARSAIRKNDIELHTTGASYGNYCYTSDAITGIITVLGKGKNGSAYNIVNEVTTMSIKEMAEMVADKFGDGKMQVVVHIPEVVYYAADTKLRLSSQKLQALGWKPKYDLESMYRRLIADFTGMDE